MKGNTQAEPEAGPEDTVQVDGAGVVVVVVVVQARVVQTAWPRESQTQVLQSCVKVVPGVHEVGAGGVVVVVVVEAGVVVVVEVVVVVVAEEVVVGQEAGQKPYSPSTWVPAAVVLVLHHGAAWPTLVQEL